MTSTAEANANISFQTSLAKKCPCLDRDREQELARRFRDLGDRRAADLLMRAHLRMVLSLGVKYRHYQVPIAELVAEGNCGLVYALTKFDPERGVRFATYAVHWVRAAMIGYIIRSRGIVNGATGPLRSRMFFKFRRERARASVIHGDAENVRREVAARLGISEVRVADMMNRIDSLDTSLDMSAGPEPVSAWLDELQGCDSPEQALHDARFKQEARVALERALAELDSRERYVIQNRLMADEDAALSLADIGRRLGVSRERARQLETRAKRKLRQAVEGAAHHLVPV